MAMDSLEAAEAALDLRSEDVASCAGLLSLGLCIMGSSIINNTILRVPCYHYSKISPKPHSNY